MTVDLHLICKRGDHWKQIGDRLFESGNWKISDKVADEAVGGHIYLHKNQKGIAWQGGTIQQWRKLPNSNRKVFTYVEDANYEVRCPGSWSMEKCVVRR